MKDNLIKVIRYMVLQSMTRVLEEMERTKEAHTHNGNFDRDAFLEDVRGWIIRYDGDDNIKGINYWFDLTDAYYFCRYGFAYAFEYYFIYRIVLRDMLKNHREDRIIINLLSLGCGSLIDLWSMKYALANINNDRLNLSSYTGYDKTAWKRTINMYCNFRYYYPCYNSLHLGVNDGNIIKCFGKGRIFSHNVIVFAKILNELERVDGLIDKLIKKIRKTYFCKEEYYICFSHSLTNVLEGDGLDISYRICCAIRARVEEIHNNGKYIMNSDILGNDKAEIFNELFNKDVPLSLYGISGENNPDSVTYRFEEHRGEDVHYRFGVFLETLDWGFSVDINDEDGEVTPYYNVFTDKMREYIPKGVADIRVDPVNHLTPLTFQIVKISRAN